MMHPVGERFGVVLPKLFQTLSGVPGDEQVCAPQLEVISR